MVKSVSGQTAPLQMPPGKPPAGQGGQPGGKDTGLAPTPEATLPTVSSLQIGVTSSKTPLQTPDLSFPPTTGALQKTGVSPEQMQALKELLGGVDGDMGAFLQALVDGKGLSDLDMSKGLNYSMSLIFASGAKEANGLAQTLDTLCRGLATPPDPACGLDRLDGKQLDNLKRMGLLVHDGKVFNLANKQEVSLPNLKALARVAGARGESLGPKALGESQASQALRHVGGLMQDAAMQLGSLKGTQDRIKAETGKMGELRDKLDRLKGDMEGLKTKVSRAEDELLARTTVFQKLQTLEQGLKKDGAAFNPGHLGLINQAVKASGLELRLVAGKLQFLDGAGKGLSAAEGQSRLRQALAAQQQQVEAARKQLESDAGALKALDGQSAQVDSALELSMLVAQALDENQTKQVNDYETKTAPALEARAKDPATPADERARIQANRAEFNALKARAPELSQRVREGVDKSGMSRAEIHRIRESLRAILANAGDVLTRRLNAEATQQRLDEAKAPGPDLELVSELEDKAAETEATLNLAPRPAEVDVEKMAKQWTELLSDLVQTIDKLHAKESDKKQVQLSFTSAQARNLQREADYHIRRLKQLDANRHARSEDILREAVAGMRKQLSVLVPQTSEGL